MHWAESQKTSGADSADRGRILIESKKVVRSERLRVFSEVEKELLRKKVMGSMFAAEQWVEAQVEGWEWSWKSWDDSGVPSRGPDRSEILAYSKPTDRAIPPNQGCGDRQDSSD